MLMAKSNMTSLVFGCLAILAIGLGLGMRFYDLSSDPGNQHLSGNQRVHLLKFFTTQR